MRKCDNSKDCNCGGKHYDNIDGIDGNSEITKTDVDKDVKKKKGG